MKHTKGEWAWQLFGDTYMLAAQHGKREIIIGAIKAPKFNYPVPAMSNNGILKLVDKDHPNAKLIAAAPDLLEALEYAEMILKELSTQGFWLKEKHNLVNTAISKATIAIKKATT